jgi:hypothetical protein
VSRCHLRKNPEDSRTCLSPSPGSPLSARTLSSLAIFAPLLAVPACILRLAPLQNRSGHPRKIARPLRRCHQIATRNNDLRQSPIFHSAPPPAAKGFARLANPQLPTPVLADGALEKGAQWFMRRGSLEDTACEQQRAAAARTKRDSRRCLPAELPLASRPPARLSPVVRPRQKRECRSPNLRPARSSD